MHPLDSRYPRIRLDVAIKVHIVPLPNARAAVQVGADVERGHGKVCGTRKATLLNCHSMWVISPLTINIQCPAVLLPRVRYQRLFGAARQVLAPVVHGRREAQDRCGHVALAAGLQSVVTWQSRFSSGRERAKGGVIKINYHLFGVAHRLAALPPRYRRFRLRAHHLTLKLIMRASLQWPFLFLQLHVQRTNW